MRTFFVDRKLLFFLLIFTGKMLRIFSNNEGTSDALTLYILKYILYLNIPIIPNLDIYKKGKLRARYTYLPLRVFLQAIQRLSKNSHNVH